MNPTKRPWPLLGLGGVAFVAASVAALLGYVAFPLSVIAAVYVLLFVQAPSGGVRATHYVAFALLVAVAVATSVGLTRLWTH